MKISRPENIGIDQPQPRSYDRVPTFAKWLSLFGCLAAGIVLCAAISLMAFRRRYNESPAIFEKKLVEARKSGLVVDMVQMQAPLPPETRNAASIYVLMTQKLKKQPISQADQFAEAVPSGASKADIDAANEVLSRQTDLMRMIHQAAAKPDCVFTRNWSQPNPALIIFPEYASIRAGARLLGTESRVIASRGNGIAAVNNAALGFHLAHHAESDHILISYLVSCAVDAITLSSLRKILYQCNGDPKVALAVREAVEKYWRSPDLTASLKGETSMSMGEIRCVRQVGPAGFAQMSGSNAAPGSSSYSAQLWNHLVDFNGAFILDEMKRSVAAAQLPNPAALEAMKPVDADIEKMNSPAYLIAAVLLPTIGEVVRKRAQVEAVASETIAGAAVLCYKGAHGVLPSTLDQAITPVPMDPFDGQPLRYKREGDGFVIYSVGPDGKFDAGMPNVKPDTKQVVFRYPCPPYEAPH